MPEKVASGEEAARYANPQALDPPPNTSWGKLLSQVPQGGRVLDVGCASGAFSSAMRRRRGCHVVGVEIDATAARAAREHCEQVIEGDIQALASTLPGDFDAIVAADVLEHLVDPASTLRALAGKLKTGGILLASIPNVTHMSVMLALVGGTFPRSREGLLDATHLRFYGEADLLDLFHGAGFAVRVVDRVQLDPRLTEFRSDLISLPGPVLEFLGQNPNADTYQFIVRAVPREWAQKLDDQDAVAAGKPAASAVSIREELDGLHARLSEYHEALGTAQEASGALRNELGSHREALGASQKDSGALLEEVVGYREQLGAARKRTEELEAELRSANDELHWHQDSIETAREKRDSRRQNALGALSDRERSELRVLYVCDRNDAPFRYRCLSAVRQLRASGVSSNYAHIDAPGLVGSVGHYSLIVLSRLGWSAAVEELVIAARSAGAAVGLELDDLIFDPDAERWMLFLQQAPAEELAAYRRGMAALAETLRRVDFCLGATPTIARHARDRGTAAIVHPNLLPEEYEHLARCATPLRRGLVRSQPLFAYMSGSITHDGDLASIAEPIAELLAARRQARLLLCGHVTTPAVLRKFGPRVLQLPYVDFRIYPWLMARCHAVVAPLEQINDFTNAKSALKVFEAGAFGVASIASPSVQYRAAIDDGTSGLVADSPGQWEAALLRLCDREEALAFGAAARATALRDHSLGAYKHVLARRLLSFNGRAARPALPATQPLQPRGNVREALDLAGRSLDLAFGSLAAPASTTATAVSPAPLRSAAEAASWVAVARRNGTELLLSDGVGHVLADRQRPIGEWESAQVLGLETGSPGCRFESLGNDPQFMTTRLPVLATPVQALSIEMRARTRSGTATGQLFWRAAEGGFSEGESLTFPLIADGEVRSYLLSIGKGPDSLLPLTLGALRFDPMDCTGEFEITQIALLQTPLPEGFPDARRELAARFPHGGALEIAALQDPSTLAGPEGDLFVSMKAMDLPLLERALAATEGVRLIEQVELPAGEDREFVAVLRRQAPRPVARGVDVIVPIYNARDYTRKCVESVLTHLTGDARLILVDDASTDPGIADDLRSFAASDPRVVVLTNAQNLGFVGTANRGLHHAEGRDVLLLNSDTEVFEGFLDRLRDAATFDAATGIVTPFSNSATIYSLPEFGDNAIPRGHSPDSMARLVAAASRKLRPEMPTAVGFCMYVRAEVIEQVGVFDEETFGRGFGEEDDLCQRARKAGFKVRLCDDVFVWHKGKASFGAEGKELEARNGDLLRRKHPEYGPEIARFFRTKPLARLHAEIRFHIPRLREGARGAVLFVLHSSPFSQSPGGTEIHVRDLVRALALPRAVIAYPSGTELIAAEVLDGAVEQARIFRFPLSRVPERIAIADEELQGALRCCLKLFGIRWAHLHHLMFWPVSIGRTLREAGVPYLFTAHDFFSVCPSWNLFDPEIGDRCACPDPAGGDPGCVAACFPQLRVGDQQVDFGELRRQFRAAWLDTLGGARAVVAPSAAVREILLAKLGLPPALVRTIEHGYDAERPTERGESGPLLRLAVLGEVAFPIKGARHYLHLAEVTRDLPLEWHFYGRVDRFGYEQELLAIGLGDRLYLHGQFDRAGIVSTLAAQGIDMAVSMPACDETFSFTLSDALIAGIPALVLDRGAIGDRVRHAGVGVVAASVQEAAQALSRFCADRAQLATYTERAREFRHRTTAQHAEDFRALFGSLGLATQLDAELDPGALRELADRAGVYVSPPQQGPPPLPLPLPRTLQRIERLLPGRLRPTGHAVLERIASRPILVLDTAKARTRIGLRLVQKSGSSVKFEAESTDPQLVFDVPSLDAARVRELRFRIRRPVADFAHAQLFWSLEDDPSFCEERSGVVPLDGLAGEWHEYSLRLDSADLAPSWRGGRVVHLRFDPLDKPGTIELGRLELR